jgi:hypothetical protein
MTSSSPPPQTSAEEPVCDTTIAVDRALEPREREALTQAVLVGRHAGAEPADWIDDADNCDAYLHLIEPWFERFGDAVTAEVAARHQLPPRLTRNLVGHALYAGIGAGIITSNNFLLGEVSDAYVADLAGRAGLWVRGYIERAGWTPS